MLRNLVNRSLNGRHEEHQYLDLVKDILENGEIIKGRNGNTIANKIAVIAKCFALFSVIAENLDVNFEKKVISVFLAEFKLIKNRPKIQSPTNKKTTPH